MIQRMRIVGLCLMLAIVMSSCAQPIPTTSPQPTIYLPPTFTASPVVTPTLPPSPLPSGFQVMKISENRMIYRAVWLDDQTFAYGFWMTDAAKHDAQWVQIDINSMIETPTTPLINFDDRFWARNGIKTSPDPNLTRGLFSPSGNYVIYGLSSGSMFSNSKTEVWLAEVNGPRRQKILDVPLIYYIGDIWWSSDESKAVFDLAYEGPASLYKVDIPTGQASALSNTPGCSGIDERGSLSPDGKMFAFSYDNLHIVDLETGSCQTIVEHGGQTPVWSQDGKVLYYWSGSSYSGFNGTNDLLTYHPDTGASTIFITGLDLAEVFSAMSIDSLYYTPNYVVSPDGRHILLWVNGLNVFLVALPNQ
jgi:Tol biopolymer transport system component